jgi:C4-dicarboxylate transporter DctM subunit
MGIVLISIGIMFFFVMVGLWIAIAIGGAAVLTIFPKLGFSKLLTLIGLQFFTDTTNFVLVAVPLFIFMGELLFRSGFTEHLYSETTKIVAGLPGGLLQTNILACTVFAACTGSSSASAAAMGVMAYEPQASRGYDKAMITGSLAAGGTLGILVPPSIMLIIYGALVGESIGRLLIAGIIPGIMMSIIFMIYIALRCLAQPHLAPRENSMFSFLERLRASWKLWPAMIVVLVVIGTMYTGIATPTEAAALGCSLSFIYLGVSRRLSWKNFQESVISAVVTTSMILFVVACAKLFAVTLSYYGVPAKVANLIGSWGLSRGLVFFIIVIIFIIAGGFVDSISMVVILIPFLSPVFQQYGFNLIWMGVNVILLCEIGLLTPPVAMNIYVLMGISGEPLEVVAKGCIPFVLLLILGIVILYFIPDLALWLPTLMKGR